MKKLAHSNDIKYLYEEAYFLGGISKYTGQEIGVGGFQEFREGEVSADRVAFINQVDFKDKNVLDVGFGRGEILKHCYDNGAKSCVGIDYSPAAFKIASKYLEGTNIKLYLLAVDELLGVKEGNFEVIYMKSVIEHIPDAEWRVFLEAAKLKFSKSCVLFAATPSVRRGDYLQMHNNYQTYANLMVLFGDYFEVVHIKMEHPDDFINKIIYGDYLEKIKKTFWMRCEGLKR